MSNSDPNTNFHLNLADELAIARTNLGNKRTLLASMRTSIGLFGVAAALLKLFQHDFLHFLGHVFIFSAIVLHIYGVHHYLRYKRYLRRMTEKHQALFNKPSDLEP